MSGARPALHFAGASLLALAALAETGCLGLPPLPPGPTFPPCPAPLVATGALPGDFSERYRVWMTSEGSGAAEPFELVAELHEARLALVAWNRFGAELFALRQDGDAVERVGRVLPGFAVPPERVLADFHRMRFLGEARPGTDGSRLVEACGGEARFVRLDAVAPVAPVAP